MRSGFLAHAGTHGYESPKPRYLPASRQRKISKREPTDDKGRPVPWARPATLTGADGPAKNTPTSRCSFPRRYLVRSDRDGSAKEITRRRGDEERIGASAGGAGAILVHRGDGARCLGLGGGTGPRHGRTKRFGAVASHCRSRRHHCLIGSGPSANPQPSPPLIK